MVNTDVKRTKPTRKLRAQITHDKTRIREAQQLRYRVFALDLGAKLKTQDEELDYDEVDQFCDHLIVIDNSSDKIVGYTRLLNQTQVEKLGYFYSQKEFNLDKVLTRPGRFLEIGRTCVDPNFRGSAVLVTLWSALVQFCVDGDYDYLFGCASIPPGPNGYAVDAIFRKIDDKCFADESLLVTPNTLIPEHLRCETDESGVPPLLKAYLRFGVQICGQPCWDSDFNVMDVFILLRLEQMGSKYSKHWIKDKASNLTVNDSTN